MTDDIRSEVEAEFSGHQEVSLQALDMAFWAWGAERRAVDRLRNKERWVKERSNEANKPARIAKQQRAYQARKARRLADPCAQARHLEAERKRAAAGRARAAKQKAERC